MGNKLSVQIAKDDTDPMEELKVEKEVALKRKVNTDKILFYQFITLNAEEVSHLNIL